VPSRISSRLRPGYHVTCAGYLNDPNGLIDHAGTYHLFYQHHPESCPSDWWNKLWAHATSPDLLHWTAQGIALRPDTPGVDALGCWSGGVVIDAGTPTALYTGLRPLPGGGRQQVLALARGDVALGTWRKAPQPCAVADLEMPPDGTFRDPFVWRQGPGWRAVIAGHHQGAEGVLLLESPDLRSWTNRGALVTLDAPDLAQPYSVLECPNLFPLGGRDVLLVSQQLHWGVFYWVGTLSGERFTHGAWRAFAPNSRLYAPLTFVDRQDRRILIGYIEEARSEAAIAQAGWCNTMTVPMQLSLDSQGVLAAQPVDELTRLRGEGLLVRPNTPITALPMLLEGLRGAQVEIEACFDIRLAQGLFIDVLCHPDGSEYTRVSWERDAGRLWVDASHASQDPTANDEGGNRRKSPDAHHWFQAPADGRLTVRIFVDRSLVEVFAHGRYVNQRAYPLHEDSCRVRVSAIGAARLVSMTMWPMASTRSEAW
jgi:beta-fructofuranosidase